MNFQWLGHFGFCKLSQPFGLFCDRCEWSVRSCELQYVLIFSSIKSVRKVASFLNALTVRFLTIDSGCILQTFLFYYWSGFSFKRTQIIWSNYMNCVCIPSYMEAHHVVGIVT